MKKLFIIVLFFPLILNAQSITKKNKIFSIGSGNLIANETSNYENGELTETNIHLMGRDTRYKHIVELVTIFYGSEDDFICLINKSIKFMEENEKGTSTTIDGMSISIENYVGMTVCYLHPKDESGFCISNLNQLKKALKKYNSFKK